MKHNRFFKTLSLLLLGTLLTGCAAVIVVGAAGSMAVYDRRSMTMIEHDARIFYQVHKAIVKDPRFRNSRILVSSFNEVVLLVGQTPTASLRGVAERIVRQVPDVRRVYDEITVDYPLPLSQRSKDSLITTEVRSRMLTQKGLESGSIRIITENGIVYLMGIATHEQANVAVNVARQVNGVNKVVKIFQYIV
jgi:osmotically-inducible protein OsmY